MDSAAIQSHVLFISASETYNLPAILKGIEGQAVLSVSDMQNFAERGGVINLKTDRDKIVFEVNLDAAKGARLAINAQILKLARVIKARS